jgi:iron complex transport system substrate-binding protein
MGKSSGSNLRDLRDLSRRRFLGISTACIGGLFGTAALSALPVLSGCTGSGDLGLGELLGSERTLVDDVGRTVTMPAASALNSVYFTSPLAQIFCFTLAPELLAGTSMIFDSEQLEFLPQDTENLEFLSSLTQGGVIDTAMLRYKDVQLIFSISGADLTDVNVDQALELEAQSGIPLFLINGSFTQIGNSYRLLGACLGRNERAEELAQYCEHIYQTVSTAVAAVPSDELVTYYYAEGPEGLLTEPDASQHSLAFQVARGINVARTEHFVAGRRELVPVSPEQIVAWDPDFILTGAATHSRGNSAQTLLRNSAAYAQLKAVQTDRVIAIPQLPFSFCDRPPGLNRFLGIQWLANLFYPRYYDVDMVEVVREFYAKCYWRPLSKEQALRILAGE